MTDQAIPLLPYERMAQLWRIVAEKRTLVHCMTNDVVQGITADLLLAAGASPAMVIDEHESADFSAIADALLINVGTLTEERSRSMIKAVQSAKANGKPWVLDPVAAGLLPWRDEKIAYFLSMQPTVIRANASEIMSLAGVGTGGHGVDSTDDSTNALEAAKMLAKRHQCIVAVTGKTDYATDGQKVLAATGDVPMATLAVGTGCSLSALVAAFCAVDDNILEATVAALMVMKLAAQNAVAQSAGPGSFRVALLDALYSNLQFVRNAS